MTFQRLCNLITQGELNYYSKTFDIIIEPLTTDSQIAYRIVVTTNKEPVEAIDVKPPLWDKTWTADFLHDKILIAKQELHAKYLTS